jgi:FkbM family methyltransferase
MDLGANSGQFASTIGERYGWHCFAVEPNPEMFRLIPAGPCVTKYNLAVSHDEGPLEFYLSDNPENSSLMPIAAEPNARRILVEALSLPALFQRLDITSVDLLKMDIEGAEISLLMQAPDQLLRGVRQITVEFHESSGRSTIDEVLSVIARLERLDFVPLKMSLRHYGDVLFVNRDLCNVHSWEIASLRYVVRNAVWAGRAVRRLPGSLFRCLSERQLSARSHLV